LFRKSLDPTALMATQAAPYFVFSRTLRLPVVSGGLGHDGRQHSPDKYMPVEGLRELEKFLLTRYLEQSLDLFNFFETIYRLGRLPQE